MEYDLRQTQIQKALVNVQPVDPTLELSLSAAPSPAVDKKQNGVFYTPNGATARLCQWAIRSKDDRILEPSFGGCSFLAAAKDRLGQLGASRPDQNLFGCDIDPQAFMHLERLLGSQTVSQRFANNDFLKTNFRDFSSQPFDVVIGNPPYVSHHNMSAEQRLSVKALGEVHGFTYDKSSLWAYFVRHSLSFLKQGGSMAWILPGSFLHADYAAKVRDLLSCSFSRSLAIQLGERLFLSEGAEEQTVVVLCRDYLGRHLDPLKFGYAEDLEALEEVIGTWQEGAWHGTELIERPNLALLSDKKPYLELLSAPEARYLGDLCELKIGIVTGANRFFILNEREAEEECLPDDVLTFVIARFNEVKGLRIVKRDLANVRAGGKRCLLVDTSRVKDVNGTVEAYLSTFPEDEKKSNRTFAKRGNDFWHRPNDGQIPDAFFPYMQSEGPGILLNIAKVTSTNSVHRLFFHKGIASSVRQAVAVSILSTFSQLSAEIEGRAYGSGVLKHEPSEARRIRIMLPHGMSAQLITTVFEETHKLLRRGLRSKAQDIADEFIFHNYALCERRHYKSSFQAALNEMRRRRQRPEKRATFGLKTK